MHLTLGVLALKDPAEVAKATAALAGALEAAGGGRGGVRVKLVGLKTFERRGVPGAGGGGGCRGGYGLGRGRGRGRGRGVVLDGKEVIGIQAEREEAQEAEGANAASGSGDINAHSSANNNGGDSGGSTLKRAWEVNQEGSLEKQEGTKLYPAVQKSTEPKNGYENCRVLWVEPRDANANVSTAEPGSVDSDKGRIGTGTGAGAEHRLEGEEEGEEGGPLYFTSCSVRNHFLSQDLLYMSPKEKENNKPILHMTVLNATYAEERRRGGGGRNRWSRGVGYNVSQLVESFKDVIWAEDVLFDKLELMQMGEVKGEIGSEREGESWYESVGTVNL